MAEKKTITIVKYPEISDEDLQLARDRMAMASRYAIKTWPYFASGFKHLRLVEDVEGRFSGPTLATTRGWVCYWNPRFVNAVSKVTNVGGKEIVDTGVVAWSLWHELQHLLSRHFHRLSGLDGGANPRAANIAGDMEINSREQPLKAWEGAVFPQNYGLPPGLLAETYLEMLPPEMKQQPQCGSCSGSDPQEGEDEGEGIDPISDMEASAIRQGIAKDVQEAESKSPGSVPNDVLVWADKTLPPNKVNWRDELDNYFRGPISGRGHVDCTYLRISRIQTASEHRLPAWRDVVPNIKVCLDTSGSMYGPQIAQACSEILGLVAEFGEIEVFAGDTQLQGQGIVYSADELAEIAKGGGGTDITAIVAEANKSFQPTQIVIVTDGELYPPPAPNHPVLWCIVGNTPFKAPYGTVLIVKD